MKKKELKAEINSLVQDLNTQNRNVYELEVSISLLTLALAGALSAIEAQIKRIAEAPVDGNWQEVAMKIDEDLRAAMSAFESMAGIPGSDDEGEEDCSTCPLKDLCPVANEGKE